MRQNSWDAIALIPKETEYIKGIRDYPTVTFLVVVMTTSLATKDNVLVYWSLCRPKIL